jgi:hypothetical protein
MGLSKFSIKERKDFKISEEEAMKTILDFCVRFDVDIDAISDKKQKKNTENLLNCLLEYVRRGFIEIDKNGKITQHLQNPPEGNQNPIVNYKTITGAQKLAMDGKDENDRYEMLYAVLGAASDHGEIAIRKLSGIDLKVAEALSIAFL